MGVEFCLQAEAGLRVEGFASLSNFERPVCSANEGGCRGYDFLGVGRGGDVMGDDLRVIGKVRIIVEFEIEEEVGLKVEVFALDDAPDMLDGEDMSCIFLNGVNFEAGIFFMTCAYDGRDEIVD